MFTARNRSPTPPPKKKPAEIPDLRLSLSGLDLAEIYPSGKPWSFVFNLLRVQQVETVN